ncbi:MAG TPA: alpha/beta hydrolase [Candidatus Limnocylindrales bacterium]|nr:alpha/beta hydrolase [Candidatus Limnocylindrales bacterium]
MPVVRANGLDIAYETRGAGPPLVLLHGATSVGREDFAAQLPLFSRAFHCIVPDARGHGRTVWDAANGFRYEWLVNDLVAFADALGLETFHLFGFSMGAMTALHFAAAHPERLRTLVVVGITTQREPRASVARRLMDPPRILRDDPTWAATLDRRHAAQGEGAWHRLLPAIASDVNDQSLLGPRDLRRIELPALVVAGDRDPFVPVDHAWGLMRQLPEGRLFVAPDCGHEVQVRRPALFNEALAGFYRSTAAEATRRARTATSTDAPPKPRMRAGPDGPRPESDVDWLQEASR